MRAKPSIRRVGREDVLLWLFVFTPVLAWIAAQQLSFLVARSICAVAILSLMIAATIHRPCD